MRRFGRATASLLLAALAVLGPTRLAWGHPTLVKSSPPAGAVLTQSPAEIRAWFSEELATKGNTLRLYDAHDTLMASGGVDPKAPKHDVLRIAPPRLGAGTYLVRWHVISADDNEVREGSFRFSIKGTTAGALPPLQIIAPVTHATVKNPVSLIVDTPADMAKFTLGGMSTMGGMGSMGAMDSGMHLHIVLDGATLMPSKDQLTASEPHRYTYTLPHLAAGPHAVKVYWADNKTHDARGPIHAAAFTCGE